MWQGNFSIKKYFTIVGIFLSLLFTSLEPRGSEGLGMLTSLTFWAIHMFIAIGILICLQKLTFRVGIFKNRRWHLLVFTACIGAIIFSFPAYYLDHFYGMPGNSNPSILSIDFLHELAAVFIPVSSTWILINAPWLLKLDFKSENEEVTINSSSENATPEISVDNSIKETPNDLKNKVGFLSKDIIKTNVIAISSELHYVRIYTEVKQYLILGSLKDVISEFEENSGIQIHRSHWVSKKYVKSIEKTKSGIICVLRNGLTFPVSRRKKNEIKTFFNDQNLINS
jgi:hypothetical protein